MMMYVIRTIQRIPPGMPCLSPVFEFPFLLDFLDLAGGRAETITHKHKQTTIYRLLWQPSSLVSREKLQYYEDPYLLVVTIFVRIDACTSQYISYATLQQRVVGRDGVCSRIIRSRCVFCYRCNHGRRSWMERFLFVMFESTMTQWN